MGHAMQFSTTIFLILGMATIGLGKIGLSDDNEQTTINVLDFGAVGDGEADDTQAFLEAWKQACGTKADNVNFIIEKEKIFLLKRIRFDGPCQSPSMHIQVLGTIIAPNSIDEWGDESIDTWLVFYNINGLIVDGGGNIDGQGSIWWQKPSKNHLIDPLDGYGNKGPDGIGFTGCSNLRVEHLNIVNPPRRHVVIHNSNGATISNLEVKAPQSSPNTDGIDISHSTNVLIQHCNIQTGDDCIAIGSNSSHINISNIACGPGHGISIGSLGNNGQTDLVEEIQVSDCTFNGTQNGVRIKTWQGGKGLARKISFTGITLNAVNNPIIIDQFYCPHHTCSNQTGSAVEVRDVSFSRVSGTTTAETAITLNCCETLACTNIFLKDINITSANSENVSAHCINAHGNFQNCVPPVDCLQN